MTYYFVGYFGINWGNFNYEALFLYNTCNTLKKMNGKELCQEDKSIRPHSSPSYSVSNGHSNSQGFEIENYALLFKWVV